jgi:hypothetical protein
VDGGEDKVSGERGVDGDLRGFLIAVFEDNVSVAPLARDV